MERTIYQKLINWKNNKNRKPLILNGARQVGKTYIVKEFAKREYKNLVYINCDNNNDVKELFKDFDMDRVIRTLEAISNESITPGETLIFLDEIQELDRGITSLKYFNEEARDYHIIVAGSLLGIHLHEGTGYPVGKVDELRLYPMSFEEFVMATGEEKLLDFLRTSEFDELSPLSEKYKELLRQYYYVGGMPEVVQTYVDSQDLKMVRRLQKQILSDYQNDFSKHAPTSEIAKINMVWNSIPSQLAKENKKFLYGSLKKGARAKEFENAIQWLVNTGLVYKVNRINKVCKPIKFYEDTAAFKLFVSDLGLLGAMSDTLAKDVLVNNKAFVEYKGAFTEQYVCQQYVSATSECPMYYTNEKSTLELDFVIQLDEVYPLEVKAEENRRSKSLTTIMKENEELKGIKMTMSAYKKQETITNIPLYAAEEWFKRKEKAIFE
ncbi:ATP-binding protein [Lachnospira multipara]|uniref:ATP-binding protein n=1 Tax=Lachnospira multipara TaxID=28051 RepID=UPI0005518DC3|nr:ATP-binding protein [Lachnospira multipara]